MRQAFFRALIVLFVGFGDVACSNESLDEVNARSAPEGPENVAHVEALTREMRKITPRLVYVTIRNRRTMVSIPPPVFVQVEQSVCQLQHVLEYVVSGRKGKHARADPEKP